MHSLCPPVVDASFLAEHPHAVVTDVRWYLDGRDGHAAFEEGHLPGAIWIDLEHDLAAVDLPATAGRHPFPSATAFAHAMAAHGIGDDSIVVAYDDTSGLTAGRLVVMLRMLGRNAAVLDGGLAAWSGPLQTGPGATPQPAAFTPMEWPAELLASADDAAQQAAAGHPVLDARAADRFTGEQALIDPRPGHIPGARNAPWSAVLGSDRKLRSIPELTAHFASLGINADTPERSAVTYCGSGVSACMNLLALEHAGLPAARLYVASWSGWSADPQRRAETGQGHAAHG